MSKISIRFFNDKEVRAVWDEQHDKWLFSVVDIVAILTDSKDPLNYWTVLKTRLKKANNELTTKCSQLKLTARDGKKYMTDCLEQQFILDLIEVVPSKNAMKFAKWLLHSHDTIDNISKRRAYELFESTLLNSMKPGTLDCLKQIHSYLFASLYDFAGHIRTKNISKGGFMFANALHLGETLLEVEKMKEDTLEDIIEKYVEMNIAHPFMEGNGRATRIWLDLMLKKHLKKCVDWSQIEKHDYLDAMIESVADTTKITNLVKNALTSKIGDRETFMKGIDYSYYYEEATDVE